MKNFMQNQFLQFFACHAPWPTASAMSQIASSHAPGPAASVSPQNMDGKDHQLHLHPTTKLTLWNKLYSEC